MTTRRTFCSSVAAFAAAGCAGVPVLCLDPVDESLRVKAAWQIGC